jgi:lambda family phage minor tail protein L
MSEGNVYEELLSSGPFAIIELFQLKTFESMHGSDNEYYFHAGRNRKTTEPSNTDDIVSAYSIYYNGHTYLPLPIEATGFEFKGDGGLPRPTIRVANLNSNITQLLLGVNEVTPGNDLNGAQVTRIRTLSRFLDGSNWENGVNPYGNPSTDDAAQMPQEVYYIDRKVAETRDFVEFEMVSSLDLANARAPRRLVMQNLCQWKYRGKECGYTGTADFTPVGQTVTYTSATNYTYTSGADKLLAGSTLAVGESLVSSNGFFTAVMQRDGNFVTYTKPEPALKYAKWATNTVRPIGDYVLVMQNDGNLVIYNNALARNDYEGGSVVWNTGTHRVATASGASFYQVDGGNQFTPSNAFGGRAGALGYELVGSQPSSGQVGNTTTAQKTFSHTDPELGARTITVTFTIRANNLPATHYTGEARAWNEYTAVAFNSATGLFRRGEIFEAKVSVSSGNPFRNNHPTVGTLTEAGILLDINTVAFTGKQLRLQDDGNLVISDTDGSDITWSSGLVINDEPEVEETIVAGVQYPPDVVGQCGKTLDDCKLRFGSGDLPFGSFPSVGQNN